MNTDKKEILEELSSRVQKLDIQETLQHAAKYFHETTERLLDTYFLTTSKQLQLINFAEKLIKCLDKALPDFETRLNQLRASLEHNYDEIKITPPPHGQKGFYVRFGQWYIYAHKNQKGHLTFHLPTYYACKARFPDILMINRDALHLLQIGWRASDEISYRGWAAMQTAHLWQIYAWAATRPGPMTIELKGLDINKGVSKIVMRLVSHWRQKYQKEEIIEFAQSNILSLLTMYLGDGSLHPDSFVINVRGKDKVFPKELVPQILQQSYRVGYGEFLDVINSSKWLALKKLIPKLHPINATFLGLTFWLVYKPKRRRFVAQTYFSSYDLAQEYLFRIKNFLQVGYLYSSKDGYMLELPMKAILQLAESDEQWRRAVQQLVQRYNIRPEKPSLRRLLELAENPPLPFST